MVTFKEMLILEKQKYLNIKKALDKKEVDFVEGRLVIKSNKSIKEYYQVKHLNNKKKLNIFPKIIQNSLNL